MELHPSISIDKHQPTNQRAMSTHGNILKVAGTLLILSLLSATLGITTDIVKYRSINGTTQQKHLNKGNLLTNNNTVCSYNKPLPADAEVKLCKYPNGLYLDISQETGTSKSGIRLNRQQFNDFKKLIPQLDKSFQ